MNILHLISGKATESLENKILNTVFSVALILCTGAGIGNLLFDVLPPSSNIIVFFSALLAALFIYLARFKQNYKLAKNLYIILLLMILPLCWFLIQGVSGTMPFYFTLFAVITITISKNRTRMFFVFFFLMIALTVVEILYPSLVVPYNDEEGRFWDFLAGNILILMLLGIHIISLKTNYDKEKDKVQTQKEVIEETHKKNAGKHSLCKLNPNGFV